MPTTVGERFEAIEECYEFMLAYAAQGLATDTGSASGRELRKFLTRAIQGLTGLAGCCATVVREESLEGGDQLRAFLTVLDRDAQDALAAMELVAAQPAISSQLVDNLNASMHLRALLTDIFLVGEVFRTQRPAADLATFLI